MRPLIPEDAAARLHENERKVILALDGRGAATTQELSAETGLAKDAVEKASAWAETKGVVSFREEVSRSFNLTEEGRKYAEEGLPETRLLALVAGGNNEISTLKEKLPSLNIALVWISRNRWATIQKGRLDLTTEGLTAKDQETLDERLLSCLKDSAFDESLDDETEARLEQLVKRNLVDISESIERWVELTEVGEALIPAVKKVRETLIITGSRARAAFCTNS